MCDRPVARVGDDRVLELGPACAHSGSDQIMNLFFRLIQLVDYTELHSISCVSNFEKSSESTEFEIWQDVFLST